MIYTDNPTVETRPKGYYIYLLARFGRRITGWVVKGALSLVVLFFVGFVGFVIYEIDGLMGLLISAIPISIVSLVIWSEWYSETAGYWKNSGWHYRNK